MRDKTTYSFHLAAVTSAASSASFQLKTNVDSQYYLPQHSLALSDVLRAVLRPHTPETLPLWHYPPAYMKSLNVYRDHT